MVWIEGTQIVQGKNGFLRKLYLQYFSIAPSEKGRGGVYLCGFILVNNSSQFMLLPYSAIETGNRSWDLHPYLNERNEDRTLPLALEEDGLYPPIVIQKDGYKGYRLLSNVIRFESMKRIHNLRQVHCVVLSENAKPFTILHHILCEQQCSTPLTIMEEAYFVLYGVQNMGEADFIHFFSHRLGSAPQKSAISELVQLVTLEEEIQLLIHSGRIDRKTAIDLLKLPSQDRIFLARLFQKLQGGANKQRRLVQLGQELAKRSSQSIIDFFSEEELQQIIHHPEMNPPQKTHFLLNALQNKLNPRKHEAELQFQKKINSLKLPGYVSVAHCQNFEKDEVFLTFKFSNVEELEKSWMNISNHFTTNALDR